MTKTEPSFRHPRSAGLVGIGAFLALAAAVSAQPAPEDALPPGPKEVLAGIVDGDAGALAGILGATRSAEDWRLALAETAPDIEPVLIEALADYLAYNVPAEIAEGDVEAAIAALPADGKEMFVASCTSCHGAERYYLTADKSFEEWLDIFAPGYHRRLLTGDGERETFASYAALLMPMAVEDIPEIWRDAQ